VALRTPVRELLGPADSASFCLSKGLACPVGSVVVGGSDFIARARRARKLVGGGMRQAGILAAAGLVALQDGPRGMIDRLAEDHEHARRLAEDLASLTGIVALDPARVHTDIVIFGLAPVARQARLVVDQRQGQNVIYRLNEPALSTSMQEFFGQFRSCQEVMR